MPYARRNAQGSIVALLAESEFDASEFLPSHDARVQAFLELTSNEASYAELDADFIRVTEDLIYTLIDRGVLQFTDLPADAQRKLLARERFRGRDLSGALNLPGLDKDEAG
jgi:hypothetical protein